MGISYIIVPTAGNVRLPLGRLSPTRAGELRLEKAAQLLAAQPHYHLAILGGRRDNVFETEAQVHYDYFNRKHEKLVNPTTDVLLDSFKCTVHDMVDFVRELRLEDGALKALGLQPAAVIELVLVAHPDQAEIAAIPLRKLLPDVKVRCEPSGEEAPYPEWKRKTLLWVTKRDPLWRKPWSWPFQLLASLRENPRAKKPKRSSSFAPT